MKKWIKLFTLTLLWGAMSCLAGCATVRTSNAVICRIQFDYADAGLDSLNVQNLRALASFKDVCR